MTAQSTKAEQPRYLALTGDLVDSRSLTNRAALQHQLLAAIDQLNELVGADLVAPYRLTAGDEVQGLALSSGPVIDAIVSLSDAVAPAQFAWGLGYGELSTDIGTEVSYLDGPCFHRSRDSLELARKSGDWFNVRGLGDVADEVLSALMNLLGDLRAGWTTTQIAYIREARTLRQVEVALRFDVDPSTVSRALRSAAFSRLLTGEAAARSLLEASL
ncbi:MAG: SatD family protein [Pseudomonadota bacterium]